MVDSGGRMPTFGEPLSDSVNRELSRVLAEADSTHELWRHLQDLTRSPPSDAPLTKTLRNALRTELARREAEDEKRIYALVEEALVTADLRPYWAARELYATTSPELTARLFPLEPDDVELELPAGAPFSAEAYESARALIRERLAAIEEATPTGSTIEAFAVLEDAISRDESEIREALQMALEAERRKHTRTARNLLRTRIALALTAGRGYEHFLGNRVAYADLSADDRLAFFRSSH
jgi:hypothetical protein